ncbi:MAG: glycosyltransferase family 2 protein, partial [Lachnospiraceae bacterium]|nr:glycosyltransferase family 2 protein [Lachnospiraceae bacterium]
MDILYIVIPAYNESENVSSVIDAWYDIISGHDGGGLSRLVIVNDGSTDDTREMVLEMKKSRPLLTLLTRVNGGHGAAVMTGYRYALANGADYIFQTDADGQTDPSYFEEFWRDRERYDAIFGMRPKRGDGRFRAFTEKVLCLLLRITLGARLPDANAPFRLMSSGFMKEHLPLVPRGCLIPNAILTAMASVDGSRYAFRGIPFMPRTHGKTSVGVKRIVSIGLRSL